MINPNSSHAYERISFNHGITQVEKVKYILDVCGPQSDRELSEKTGIPRHLLPARRGQLVKLGAVKRLKSVYDQVTRQTVDVWATVEQVEKMESKKASLAVRQVLTNAQRDVSKVVAGGLFSLVLFVTIGSNVEAAKITRKMVVRTSYARVTSIPTATPTPTPQKTNDSPVLNRNKQEIKNLVCRYFGKDCQIASAVFIPESGLSCSAVGDNHLVCTDELMGDGRTLKEHCIADGVEYGRSYGVAQIRYLPGRPTPEALLNCETNIKYAHGMWKAQSWYPWSAFTNGAYLNYLSI